MLFQTDWQQEQICNAAVQYLQQSVWYSTQLQFHTNNLNLMTNSCTLYNIKLNGTDGSYCSNNAVGHQTTSYNGLLQNHTNFFVLHSIVISSSLNAVTYHTITTNIETQFETTATHNHRIGQNTFIPSSALSIQANITCNFVTAWEGNSIITIVQALCIFKLRAL